MITLVKRLAILLLIQGVFFDFAHADESQDLKNLYNSYLPNFQKLTPEASALGQYGKYGVSSYTGAPDISVPLFTIGSGSFSMPVELKYDASGIKVEQEATYVGLGWNLMMGGSITHIVCGQNDFEDKTSSYITNLDLLKLVEGDNAQKKYFSIPHVVNHVAADWMLQNKKWTMLENVFSGHRIPDIYQASFCGHNVSFVIVNDSARIIDNNATKYKIKIKTVNSIEKSIEITDDHGIRYVFVQAQLAYVGDNRLFNLSKICNAAECLAEFKYTTGTFFLKKHYYESVGKPDRLYKQSIPQDGDIYNLFIRHKYPDYNTFFENINKSYPDTIKTNREIITFTYSDRRTDIKGAKQIDAITVKSRIDNSIIHTVAFKYGYFTERNIDTDLCGTYRYSIHYGYTRLKLADVTIDGKKYSFEYNNENDLPARLSRAQDFWGYYNGQENKDGFCATPQYQFDREKVIMASDTVGPANRYASEECCKVGTLKKITYPTGGYSLFDFEIHHFEEKNGYYFPSATSFPDIPIYESVGLSNNNGTQTHTFTFSEETEVQIGWGLQVVPYSGCRARVSLERIYPYYESIEDKLISVSPNSRGSYYKKLSAGEYKLTATIENYKGKPQNTPCYANINAFYYKKVNKESIAVDSLIADASGRSIGGGLRIRTIENYDSDSKLIERTIYKYEDGKLLLPTVRLEHLLLFYGGIYSKAHATGFYDYTSGCVVCFATSDSSYPEICSFGSPNVGYSKVIKERYDRDSQLISYDVETYNNNGYKEYENNPEIYGYVLKSFKDLNIDLKNKYYTDGTYHLDKGDIEKIFSKTGVINDTIVALDFTDPFVNKEANMFHVNLDGLNGKIISSTTYSNNGVPMHETNYAYTVLDKPAKPEDVVFFPWCRRVFPNQQNTTWLQYRYSLYPKYITNVLPSEVTEINYVNGTAMKPVTTTFEYNANNYQPANVTKSVTLNSQTSDVVTTRYWYPNDSEVSSSNPSYLTKANCVSEKVKAVEYRNGKTVGGYRNVYGSLSNGLPIIKKNYSITSSNSEILELNVTYYDKYGNIRQYKKKDGTPVTIIWSYNHQHPIMEIVGKTYDQVKTAYSSITSLEDKPSVAETTMSSIHATLRKNLPDALVTAYTYSPWHTVSEIIQPNGNKTKYAYDSYGRLEETKDINDKTLQKYSYNYKNK